MQANQGSPWSEKKTMKGPLETRGGKWLIIARRTTQACTRNRRPNALVAGYVPFAVQWGEKVHLLTHPKLNLALGFAGVLAGHMMGKDV